MAYAKPCKYGCSVILEGFDEQERKYIEKASGELHTKERCDAAKVKTGTHSTQQTNRSTDYTVGTFDTQKSADIKAAQKERRQQHRELIITMKNLTKAILFQYAEGHKVPINEVEDSIGFEQYREDQQSFQDEVV